MSCFFSFWFFGCKFLALWQNKLIETVKTSFTVFPGFFMKNVFLYILQVFSSLLHFEQNVLSFFVGKSRNGCQNRILRVQKINFLVKILNYPQMFILFVLTAKNSLRKLFGRLLKSVLVRTTLKFWGRKFFEVLFFYLGLWLKFLCLMAKETQRSCQTSFSESRRLISLF